MISPDEHKCKSAGSELVLYTDRLTLRPITKSDAELLVDVFGDSDVMEFGDGALGLDEIESWVDKHILQYEKSGHPVCSLRTTCDNNFIGYCGLFNCEIDNIRELEVGYRLAKPAWGQGFATEAARAMLNFAQQTLKYNRIVAMIDPANLASVNVATKLGMNFEKEFMMPSYDHPDHLYVSTVRI